jgi:hypothetical protein
MPNQFLNGAIFFGFLISAHFFFRFWSQTRDRLFLMFAISFLLLAVERTVASFVPVQAEHQFYVYGIRLVAFILLICAILDKNRRNQI